MKNLSKTLLGPVQVVILSLILAGASSLVYAGSYQEPNCSPPSGSCNAEAPLNVSDASQIKLGRLTIGSGSGLTTGLRVSNGAALFNNSVAIGFSGETLPNSSYKLDVNGSVRASAFFYSSSDRSLKTKITPLTDSLSNILKLQGVSYVRKSTGLAEIGLIAQDVEKIYPQVVTGSEGEKSVDYSRLVTPLIEAVKAQQKEIDQLKAAIKELQARK